MPEIEIKDRNNNIIGKMNLVKMSLVFRQSRASSMRRW